MELQILGLNVIGMPMITATIGEDELLLLLDTGATDNMIFEYVYNEFKDTFTELDRKPLFGIDGEMIEHPRTRGTFCIGGVKYTEDFSVMSNTTAMGRIYEESNVQIHGILGIGFFVRNKWILDFENWKIHRP